MSADGRVVCKCGHLLYSHRSDGQAKMPCTAIVSAGARLDFCGCRDFEKKS